MPEEQLGPFEECGNNYVKCDEGAGQLHHDFKGGGGGIERGKGQGDRSTASSTPGSLRTSSRSAWPSRGWLGTP